MGSCVAEIYGLAAYYGNFTVRCLFLRSGGAGLISLGIKIIIISRPSRKLPACLSFSRYDFGNGRLSSFHPQPPGGGQAGHLLRLYCPLCKMDEERQCTSAGNTKIVEIVTDTLLSSIEQANKISLDYLSGEERERERERERRKGEQTARRRVASRLVTSPRVTSRHVTSRHVTSRNVGRTAVEWNESRIRSPVCAHDRDKSTADRASRNSRTYARARPVFLGPAASRSPVPAAHRSKESSLRAKRAPRSATGMGTGFETSAAARGKVSRARPCTDILADFYMPWGACFLGTGNARHRADNN